MSKTSIQQKIRSYLLFSHQWNQENEPVITQGSTGSIMLSLEEEILIHFGLPPSAYQYTSQMEKYGFSDEDIDEKADELYRWLRNEATTYLLSAPENNYQTLKNSKSKLLHAQEVLPFLGYGVTEYNSFIYHDIYCKSRCSTERLLEAIKIEGAFIYNGASEVSFPFKDEYRSYLSSRYSSVFEGLDLAELETINFEAEYPTNKTLKINRLLVLSFTAHNPNTCIVDVAIEHWHRLIKLKVWCTLSQLHYILNHARYLSDVSRIKLQLRYNNYSDREYIFNEAQVINNIIEVPVIDMEFEHLDKMDKDSKMLPAFIISYYDPYCWFSS